MDLLDCWKDFLKDLKRRHIDISKFIDSFTHLMLTILIFYFFYYIQDYSSIILENLDEPFLGILNPIIIVTLLYFGTWIMVKFFQNSRRKYFLLLSFIIVVSMIGFMNFGLRFSIIVLSNIIVFPSFYYDWDKIRPNPKAVIAIVLMSLTLLGGIIYVSDFYGPSTTIYYANECGNYGKVESQIEIECSSPRGHWMIWDSKISCLIKTEGNITDLEGTVYFETLNGSTTPKQTFADKGGKIEYIVPERSETIFIDFLFLKEGEKQIYCYDSLWNNGEEFISYEEYIESREKFFIYILVLFGIIFITVPSVIRNLFGLVER